VVSVVLPGSIIIYTTSRFIAKKRTKLLAKIPKSFIQLDISRQLPNNYIFYPEFINIIPVDKILRIPALIISIILNNSYYSADQGSNLNIIILPLVIAFKLIPFAIV
jgi:hypothetical protein